MSLISEAMEEFVRIGKTPVADGYGGMTTTWADGDSIQAVAVPDTSTQGTTGERQGVYEKYFIYTRKEENLLFHDVLRRESDGTVFRVTTNGTDKKTPASACLDLRRVDAEVWKIPEEDE